MPEAGNAAGTEDKKVAEGVGQPMSSKERAILFAREASRFKALDLVILDVARFTSFADYFVICSGKSSRQVQGIADNVESNLKDMRIKPLGVEGRNEGHWVLMDYGDVIFHIFYEPIRFLYDLESLWADASRLEWKEDLAEGLSQKESG